jgi:hypothetical protein
LKHLFVSPLRGGFPSPNNLIITKIKLKSRECSKNLFCVVLQGFSMFGLKFLQKRLCFRKPSKNMKLKLIIRYTSGSSEIKNIDPDDSTSIVEAMNATDFDSLILTRLRHPAESDIRVTHTKKRTFESVQGC